MVKNPDVFMKAREELDRVVGQERLPDFEDRPSLPYINALQKELYRYILLQFKFITFRLSVIFPDGILLSYLVISSSE